MSKTYRPIWDRTDLEPPPPPEPPPPRVPQPPPASVFEPRREAALRALPNFNEFVPPDLAELRQQMDEARDMSDALAALRAIWG